MGYVDPKSGDVSNVDEYSYGRQILEVMKLDEARQVWLTFCTRFSHCRGLQVILYVPSAGALRSYEPDRGRAEASGPVGRRD